MGTEGVALGLDVGGTKVAAALMDGTGAVLARARGAVDPGGNEAGLTSVFRVADECLEGAGGRLVGIGAGCPGSIDWRAGVVRAAANLAWRGLPLAGALRARYGVPALVDNDVNVAAWGERCFGAGRAGPAEGAPGPVGEAERGGGGAPSRSEGVPSGAAVGAAARRGRAEGANVLSAEEYLSSEAAAPAASPPQGAGRMEDDLVFLTVGTGIGAGLIAGGRIVRGRGTAGEVGHIPLFEGGPRCACGLVGCLEAVASGPAFARAGRELAEAGGAPGLLARVGGDAGRIDAPAIVRAAVEGDPVAARLLDREGYYLALAVLIAGRLLDPARVVLGGGLTEAGEALFGAVWDNLARLRPRGPAPPTYAVPTALGADAGAAGAAALVLVPEPGFVEAGLSL